MTIKVNYFSSNIKILKYYDNNFVLQFTDLKDIYLFNCSEGCQYFFSSYNYKINNISKIILTSMQVDNVSGLIGLLSSLNLMGRIKSLHIYCSKDLVYYLELNKKYSHTNFNYLIYIHVLTTGLIINHCKYRIYTFIDHYKYNFLIIEKEKAGTFLLNKAIKNGLIPNSLYGKLKMGLNFKLPDGYLLNGNNFTSTNLSGNQISFVYDIYFRRLNVEMILKSKFILY